MFSSSLRRQVNFARLFSRRRRPCQSGPLALCSTAVRGLSSHPCEASDGKLKHSCHQGSAKPMAWPLALVTTGVICGIRGRQKQVSKSRSFFQGSPLLGALPRASRPFCKGLRWALGSAMSADPRDLGKEKILVLPVFGLVGSKGHPLTAPSGFDHAWITGTRFGTAVGKLGISVCKRPFLLCICRQGCCG